MAAFSNWLELPDHLQALFMNKLIFIKDYIHFGAVCRPWRSLLDQYIDLEKLPRPQLPLLMIPSSSSSSYPSSIDKKKDNERDEKWSFYSLTQTRVYDLGIKLPYNQHCRGSSHGWLVTVEEDTDFSVRLFNPFLQDSNEIKLPPLKSFELNPHVDEEVYDYLFLKKAILSKDPTSSNTKDDDDDDEDLLVIVIYGEVNRLAIYKPGDESWTSLTYEWFGIGTTENYKPGMLNNFSDVAYSKGMVYAVQWRGTVVSFDMHAIIAAHASHQHPNPKVFKTVATSTPLNDYGGKMKYIVESSGDLLQVQRFYQGDATKEFRVFKLLFDPTTEEEEEKQLNQESKSSKWIEVKTLQGRILFLGDNDSISLSPLDCPRCKPNCIYFTDDDFERYWLEEFPSVRDIGVFNLEDGSVEQHYPINSNASIFPPPIWVHPTMTLLQIISGAITVSSLVGEMKAVADMHASKAEKNAQTNNTHHSEFLLKLKASLSHG